MTFARPLIKHFQDAITGDHPGGTQVSSIQKHLTLHRYFSWAHFAILVLGLIGGWAGERWPYFVLIYAVQSGINRYAQNRLQNGIPLRRIHPMYAANNFLAAIAMNILAGVSNGPFWMFFAVNTLATATLMNPKGIPSNAIALLLINAGFLIDDGLLFPDLLAAALYPSVMMLVGTMFYEILKHLEHESARLRAAEAAARASEERLRLITDNMLDLAVMIDPRWRFVYTNPSFTSLLGHTQAEVLGRSMFSFIHPDERRQILAASANALTSGAPIRSEMRLRHASGRYLWVECVGSMMLGLDGLSSGAIIVGRDNSSRHEMEHQIRASLREKEVLLKEIHHRVKNNLQVISSILYLQSTKIADPYSLEVFLESQNRVRSMALIHELLYRSERLAQVDFEKYIHRLGESLFQAYARSERTLTFEVDARSALLPIDSAVPCGLILNELISNALKHAFSDRSRGTVRVHLSVADRRAALTVADDGVGLPDDLDIFQTSSLGLQLVTRLVDQLEGQLTLGRGPAGTAFLIEFPLPEPTRQ